MLALGCSATAFAGKETATLDFSVVAGSFQNPGDIAWFRGQLVWTEIYKNRLAFRKWSGENDPDNANNSASYLTNAGLQKKLKAPHYLATRGDETLYVTNGWGHSILSMTDLEGGGLMEFYGGDQHGFNAPHGICIDRNGWIVVADSLNSRLVRFRDMQGRDWQVFADHDKRISYGRQLNCNADGIWLANSYEKRPGLNPGTGGNILHIADFNSGKARIVVNVPQSNLTAVAPVGQDRTVLALWGHYRLAAVGGPGTEHDPVILRGTRRFGLGIPYAAHYDAGKKRLLLVMLGTLEDRGRKNPGGVLSLEPGNVLYTAQ